MTNGPKVELRQHVGRNVISGRSESLKQYQIFLNGRMVGYIGWKPGSSLCLIERIGPIEREAIEKEIAAKLCAESPGKLSSVIPPDVPDEIMNPPEDSEDYDDFD